MTRVTKEGQTVEILKQYRNQSNNYVNSVTKIYADLYRIRYNDGRIGILCSTELE